MKIVEYTAALASVAAIASASSPSPQGWRGGETKFPPFPKPWFPPKSWPQFPRLPHPFHPPRGPREKPLVKSEPLQASIKEDAIRKHAENLQAIAYATEGRNRVFGSAGHNFTAKYIYDLIKELDDYYTVEYQPFVELYSGGSAEFVVNGQERGARLMTYAPNGRAEAKIVVVNNFGCNRTDFPAEVTGSIALISRGSCEFGLKAALAGAAGAAGAVIHNNINGTLSGTLGAPERPEGKYPPTAAIPQDSGLAIRQSIAVGEVIGRLNVNSILENRTTINVIAQTKGGDQNNVLMVGAHSDSVDAGPGINDDGSGTVGILEVALQLAKYKTNNAIRFGWWSAEEFGLLGSEFYVNTTAPAELDKIRLYLNFDMIASPNYIYGIYDGDGSAFNTSGPPGSAQAEKLFEDFYAQKGLRSQPTEFSGRSDYGPFLAVGIAAGGLFTGAENIKTAQEAEWYGGEAGVAYDKNYHAVGDTVDNLNMTAFLVNTKAIAHSIATYGRSFETLPAPTRKRFIKRDVAPAKKSGCHHKHVEHVEL
ncbi:Leucyl aminopeptidase yscIV [Coniosporium tulheliwenetii]|uniref:Leucyl aminopeptidase yscIV n=1 Tax=Coniosporium tulheliwenetii TaxID=3383036 RepID=A0ACC2ZF72_9PEZI|nr:Leucyl aminopeptidase yscIV [Cladosporium sp. JES 115]